jgi:hypothetical protein
MYPDCAVLHEEIEDVMALNKMVDYFIIKMKR